MLGEAIANNVAWCSCINAVARAVPVMEQFGGTLFNGVVPQGYPNFVSMMPGISSDQLKALVATLRALRLPGGFGIKDSFAQMNLEPYGFELLLEGRWIEHRGISTADQLMLRNRTMHWINEADVLEQWCHAADLEELANQIDLVRLAARDDVHVLEVRRDGEIVAGAIFNLSGTVAGVSNVFSVGPADDDWPVVVQAGLQTFGRPLVGWESQDNLGPAVAAGFEAMRPMRVWLDCTT